MSPGPIAEANRKRKRDEADGHGSRVKKEISKHDKKSGKHKTNHHTPKAEQRHEVANGDTSSAHRKRQRVDATDRNGTSSKDTPTNATKDISGVSEEAGKPNKKHRRRTHEEIEQIKALEVIGDLTTPNEHKQTHRNGREDRRKGISKENESIQDAHAKARTLKRAEKRKKKKEHQKLFKELEEKSSWSLSKPIGGQFIDTCPVFSHDEKFIIIATASTVQVYSTSTSLLIHTLRPAKNHSIIDYKISPTQPSILYILTIATLIKWDFKNDKMSEYPMKTSDLICLACFSKAEDSEDVILTVEDAKPFTLKLHSLPSLDDNEKSNINSVVLLKNQKPIREVSVSDDGQLIIAMTMDSFIIGQSLQQDISTLESVQYNWREIPSPEKPMCFGFRLNAKLKTEKGVSKTIPSIDLAVGGLNGCIYLFEDILNRLDKAEKPSKSDEPASDINAKEFHWHREAVGSVTWSKDGNYLISGGQETVLVLWQLETGRKQFLPHLESPIRNIVVSPSGTSYGIRLGDNSVMVLSTSELTPTAIINGIQSMSSLDHAVPKPLPATLEVLSQLQGHRRIARVAATINPRIPDQLLLATPAHQTSNTFISSFEPAPYLQTYNMSTSRHVSRQPLLRTNATSTNLGPEGNKIREPDLKFVQISHDGNWLATIDEWAPPQQDLDGLTINGHDVDGLEASQRETHFKFWRWNKESQSWMLNSRIDRPHQFEGSKTSGRILGLVAFPTTNRFASVGDDSVVKIWKPKSRKVVENIKQVKERKDKGSSETSRETSWTVECSIPLERAMNENTLAGIPPKRASMALSNDGSVLAINQYFKGKHSYPNGLIHFIDADNGLLKKSHIVIQDAEDGLDGLEFLERYLICVNSQSASIWDVTSFVRIAHVPLQPPAQSSSKEVVLYNSRNGDPGSQEEIKRHKPSPHLAMDLSTWTFAVSHPETKFISKTNKYNPLTRYGSRIQVYSLLPGTGVELLYESVSPRLTMALLPAAGVQSEDRPSKGSEVYLDRKGFVVLDAGAEIRFLRPQGDLTSGVNLPKGPSVVESVSVPEDGMTNGINPTEQSDTEEQMPIALLEIPEEGASAKESTGLQDISASLEKNVDDRPVVRPEQLAQVFDHPSHAMPSVLSMFNSVVRLFAAGGHKRDDDAPLAPSSPSMQLQMEIDSKAS